MTKETRSLGELIRVGAVILAEVHAAADAYVADPAIGRYEFSDGRYAMDLGAVVRAHKATMDILTDPHASDGFKRTMVLTALVLGPVERW